MISVLLTLIAGIDWQCDIDKGWLHCTWSHPVQVESILEKLVIAREFDWKVRRVNDLHSLGEKVKYLKLHRNWFCPPDWRRVAAMWRRRKPRLATLRAPPPARLRSDAPARATRLPTAPRQVPREAAPPNIIYGESRKRRTIFAVQPSEPK